MAEKVFVSPYKIAKNSFIIPATLSPYIQKTLISETNTADETDVVVYTVPDNYFLVLISCWLTFRTTTAPLGTGSARLYITGLNGSLLSFKTPNLANQHNAMTQQFANGVVFPPKTVFKVSTSSGGAGSLVGTAGIFGYLVDQQEYQNNKAQF